VKELSGEQIHLINAYVNGRKTDNAECGSYDERVILGNFIGTAKDVGTVRDRGQLCNLTMLALLKSTGRRVLNGIAASTTQDMGSVEPF